MKDTVKIVTTWSDAGYEQYGQYWCKAVEKHVPKDWIVKVYGTQTEFNFNWYNWDVEFPEWKNYCNSIKLEWDKVNSPNDIKARVWFDRVIKFAHKGVVIAKELRNADTRYMIWLDGDAIFHNTIPDDWHLQLLQNHAISTQYEHKYKHNQWSWVHIESGIMVFDLEHPTIKEFIDVYSDYYDNPNKLVTMRKPYDTYVAVESMKKTNVSAFNLNSEPSRITGNPNETFLNPLLRNFVIHWITNSKSLLTHLD
jgi:hypothetical protein